MLSTNLYRTIWLSDFHLGTRECKASFLLDFLRHNESETLYLVGDVIDGWALARSWNWSQLHNDVIQKILRKARKGTEVVYLPGNHDEFAHDYSGLSFGQVRVESEVVHTLADGRKMLVLHGDLFDGVIRRARWLSVLGSRAYRWLLKLNRLVSFARSRLGLPYWSLSAYLKYKTKRAVQFIANFEANMVQTARTYKADGIVCGHIHYPEIRSIEDCIYANAGDWVENCTALVEHFDGRLELIRWAEIGRRTRPGPVRRNGHKRPVLQANPALT